MVRYFYKLSKVLLIGAFALTSCNGDRNKGVEAPKEEGQFKIVFSSAKPTKADNTATEWEKKISNLTIFVYKIGGSTGIDDTAVKAHAFTAQEIANLKLVFSMSDVVAGADYEFYAVANYTFIPTTDEDLKALTRKDLNALLATDMKTAYNSAFETLTDGSFFADKAFVMAGITKATAPTAGVASGPTTVTIELSRPVAKLAVNTQLTSEFIGKYGSGNAKLNGVLKIKNVYVSYFPKEVPVLPVGGKTMPSSASDPLVAYTPSNAVAFPTQTAPTFAGTDNTQNRKNISTSANWGTYAELSQVGSLASGEMTVTTDINKNLFYVFNTGFKDDDIKIQPQIYIEADYTANGSTTPIVYNAKLDGELDTSKGRFLSNGYYSVTANIKGLTAQEVDATITVTDWASPVTQTIDFGN